MSEWQPLPSRTVLRERYEVEALLGKGGFGATYRARDRERFDQPCALQELLPAKAENPKVLELFEREARILLALRHPGIPALNGHPQQALVVRSLISGGSAQRAGMRDGDVLLSVDGRAVPGPVDLLRVLSSHPSNAQVRLEFVSGGRRRATVATLMGSPFPDFLFIPAL